MSAPAHRLHQPVLDWYAEHARDLPWRNPDCSAWGVLVSEVMLQQTPVARVLPVWADWMQRWATPDDLAGAPVGAAVRAWGRLGYPRRALRLHAAATVITSEHAGAVPCSVSALRELPGVGDYTAAAVAAFAFGERTAVVDTNVRRVLARALGGEALPAPSLRRGEVELAARSLPVGEQDAARWNVAVMELGALVCGARSPSCGHCPIAAQCAWRLAGHPAYQGAPHRTQAWAGSDRQCRGRLLQCLRDSPDPRCAQELSLAWPDDRQRARCLDGLVADGLVQPLARGRYRLPE
ncbi:MAG: A/G-specific adenine glycosylase [Ornithinimicrobium sp.]|uniref:A/G-specific adenine glycosylase n=1 Tax=Ornithinimicrobium sp. TaxID=1977084 RepID=UPI003D9B908C